ncbi:unnamed protein product [Linum tenue]|uniref:Uncharacterized protein n=1 Tax=Linum tenue TaxID=586396 RepID=A0AAV0Q8E6_9ROSI|nr:unnamed protein product [Linum tenue]
MHHGVNYPSRPRLLHTSVSNFPPRPPTDANQKTKNQFLPMNSTANSLRFSSPLCPRFQSPAKSPTLTSASRFSFVRCSFPSSSRRRSRRSGKRKLLQTSTSTARPSLHLDDDLDRAASAQSLELVLDLDQLSYLASSNLRRFISSGRDAYADLSTLVSFDESRRIVFSCRKSTVRFTGMVLLCGFVFISAVRVLIGLGLAFRRSVGFRREKVVVRRDRSLGGREVVVATAAVAMERDGARPKRKRFGVLDNPLSSLSRAVGENDWKKYLARRQNTLPKWWPSAVSGHLLLENQEEYQREAKRLIRAITDYRTSGKDFAVDDIIQLRRICRTSGVKVSFDTTNTRDALFRASVDFVLNMCSRNTSYESVPEIDAEDVRQFIAGLADNIGLENIRAARIVSAGVAARTHSCFLQAWALDVQGKHSEAVMELLSICSVLHTFPPDESSPEMEMVAEGLGKHLKVEQRELLLDMFCVACSCKESHRSAADALGLVLTPSSSPLNTSFHTIHPFNFTPFACV